MNAAEVSRVIRSRLISLHYDIRRKLDAGDGPVLPGDFYMRVDDRISERVWDEFGLPEDTRP